MIVKLNKAYPYNMLCHVFNMPIMHGNAKRRQLEKLGREYDIKENKAGNYIILKRFNEIEKVENISYGKNKAYITPMIYTLLSSIETNTIKFDMKDLLEILSLVNKNYYIAKWNKEKTDMLITGEYLGGLDIFIKETEPMLKRIVKDVLYDMQDKQLINITEIPTFAIREKGINGRWYTKTHEINNELEYPIFMESRRLALKNIGVENWSELNYIQAYAAKKFVENYLKTNIGVDYFFFKYEIILNKKGISEFIKEDFEGFSISFNKYIQNKILTSTRKKLQVITKEEKEAYVDALIDINSKLNLKEKL